MPRSPEPEGKTFQVVCYAKNAAENEKIKAFKEICRRNKDSVRDIVMNGAIDRYLEKHHWHPIRNPHGHSQMRITEFSREDLPRLKCHFCAEVAVDAVKYIPTGDIYVVCAVHLKERKGHPRWRRVPFDAKKEKKAL
jgi:hypothetical protein